MDHNDQPILTLDINLHFLAILGLFGALFIFAISYVSAQDDLPGVAPVAPTAAAAQPEDGTDLPVLRQGDRVFSANGEWLSLDDLGAPVSGEAASSVDASGDDRRQFYLAKVNSEADQALSACAGGYHMASLWEILDVSNLSYAYGHPAAYTKDDSGAGPPSYWNGWVRTGWNGSSENSAGQANCDNWSQKATGFGTIVRLVNAWGTTPGEIFTWDATAFQCTGVAPVWCVEDPSP